MAGMFYSGNAQDLEANVRAYLDHAAAKFERARAIIAPHAGFIYSGPIAASVYAPFQNWKNRITRVVILGPSHRSLFNGLGLPDSDYFRTPLGDIPVERESLRKIESFDQVEIREEAHAAEHSLEVQLPFLQLVLSDFSIIPVAVGHCEPEFVCSILEELGGGEDTLIVVSSDLSHYLDYETARRRDEKTARIIEKCDPHRIDYEDACGRNAVNGLLELARRKGWRARTVDLRNSGDTAGDKSRVVGYGGFVFE